MNKEEVKDYIDHALQSSRGLTSDLASDIIKKMGEKIDTSIDKSVNGKIIKLTEMMQNHIEHDKEWKIETDNWKKSINDWITNSTPAITAVNNTRTFSSITGQIATALLKWGSVGTLLYGLYLAIKKWFL